MGRWVFCMQFRRPFMSHFEAVWEVIGKRKSSPVIMRKARRELVFALCGIPLLHSFLGCRVDNESTCSDASMKGGAIAVGRMLTGTGSAFLRSQEGRFRPQTIPVILISLFHGIGGSSRCYDVAGAQVKYTVAAECHAPANRVASRRWPETVLYLDVRQLTEEILSDILEKNPDCVEIHVWAGFPCVDLSAAKLGRENLAGKESSLIFEVIRILDCLLRIKGDLKLIFVIENVASMDTSAREELTQLLKVTPMRLNPASQVPMNRPRYCWTNLTIFELPGVRLVPKDGYVEVEVEGEWPASEGWLEAGSFQRDPNAIYPTFMKCIRRSRPPPGPVGIHRDKLEFARRQKRKGIALTDRGITKATLDRYYLAVRRVLPVLETATTNLDHAISLWIEEQYLAGKGITEVSDALSGLHHFNPQFRGTLQESWRLFGVWRRIERPRQAPPLPISFLFGLLGKSLSEEKLALCATLAAGFWGMLRTGELMKLQLNHLLVGPDTIVIQLGMTKTGLRRAIDENVVIHDPLCRELMEAWIDVRRQTNHFTSFFWPYSSTEFRNEFRRLVKFFGFPSALRPYSLRRGGATYDFQTFGQMERTLMKGRWGTSAAARHYVQEGLSEITRLHLPPSRSHILLQYATLLSNTS
eukprot:Skav219080  [mRNA]  locus=scaffold1777:97789:100561:- [translate_table: standard]